MQTSMRTLQHSNRTQIRLRSSRSLLLPDRRICTVKSSKQRNTVPATMGTPVLYTYPLAYNPFKAALVSSTGKLGPCL
jgi:hypothetical protein